MSNLSVAAAGPGDPNNSRRGKKPELRTRSGRLQTGPPPPRFRYVTLPDGNTIWRPNAPGFDDQPGGAL